jgi:hypothetical protein
MRIVSTFPPQSKLPVSLGPALQGGVIQSASVATEDILDLSGLAITASALGSRGIQALQKLAGQSSLTEARLQEFVDRLSHAGTSTSRIGDILAQLSDFGEALGGSGLADLFTGIESRGISGDLKYLDRLDNLFNLGHRDVSSLFKPGAGLSDEEFGVFLSSAASLLQQGVVGTETVEFRGQPTTVFLENEIGSDYAHAPLYRRKFPF